jgi:hypothetical protein
MQFHPTSSFMAAPALRYN